MFTKFINLPVFLISFIIGLVFVRISAPETTTVFVFPTPDNIGLLEFKDKASNCFEYHSKSVPCPEKKEDITHIPPQMGNTTPKKIEMKPVSIGTTTINKV